MNVKTIINIFLLLILITIIEFGISLCDFNYSFIKNIIYLILTFIKAYYILAYFMHLKFENSMFTHALFGTVILFLFLLLIIIIDIS